MLRITIPANEFRIISVGPIQERNVINSITNGRFIPIKEPVQIESNLIGAQP